MAATKFRCGNCGVTAISSTKGADAQMPCRVCGTLMLPEDLNAKAPPSPGTEERRKPEAPVQPPPNLAATIWSAPRKDLSDTARLGSQTPAISPEQAKEFEVAQPPPPASPAPPPVQEAPAAAPSRNSGDVARCPSCFSYLKPDAAICVKCGRDLRTGKSIGQDFAKPERKASGKPLFSFGSLDAGLWGMALALFLLLQLLSLLTDGASKPATAKAAKAPKPVRAPTEFKLSEARIGTANNILMKKSLRIGLELKASPGEGLEAVLTRLPGNKEGKPVELGRMERVFMDINGYMEQDNSGEVHFELKDTEAFSLGKNWLDYQIDVIANGKILETFGPLGIPVIPPPEIKGKTWFWKPLDPTGPIPSFLIIEETCDSLISHFEPSSAYASHDFSKLPEKLDLKLQFELPFGGEERIMKGKQGCPLSLRYKIEGMPFKIRSQNKIPPHIAMERCNYGISYSGDNKVLGLESVVAGDEAIPLPCRPGEIGRKGNLRPLGDFTDKEVLPLVAGKELCLSLLRSEIGGRGKRERLALNCYMPPYIDNLKATATEKGNLLEWELAGGPLDVKQYATQPKISVTRWGDGPVTRLAALDPSAKSFLDNTAPAGSICEYSVYFDEGALKSQGIIDGVARRNFYVMNRSEGAKAPMAIVAKTSAANLAEPKPPGRLLEREAFILSADFDRSKWEEDEASNRESGRLKKGVVVKTEGPLRVGIFIPDLCHERTGLLERDILSLLLLELPKEPCVELYDRMALLEFNQALSRNRAGSFTKEGRLPLDFMVRLRDYSHEEDNGIEIWVTKIDPNEDDLNTGASWMLCRIDLKDAAKGVSREKITLPLLEMMKRLSQETKTLAGAPPKQSPALKPARLFIDALKPIEQQSQVCQFAEIGETLTLAASSKLADRQIFTRDDWLLVNRELLMKGGKEEVQPSSAAKDAGDLLVSGRVWKTQDGSLGFLFAASDMKDGKYAGAFKCSGSVSQASEAFSKWVASLEMPSRGEAKPLSSYDKARILTEDYLKPFTRWEKVEAHNVNGGDAFFLAENGKTPLQMAKQQWAAGNCSVAVMALEKLWSEASSPEVADCLAECYHSLGLYGSEASLLRTAESSRIAVKDMAVRLSKAASLSKNANKSLILDEVRKRRPAGRAFGIGDNLSEQLAKARKQPKGTFSYLNNPFDNIERLLYAARSRIGEEWNKDGRLFAKEIFYGNDLPLTNVNDVLANKNGVWVEVGYTMEKTLSFGRAKIKTWQSIDILQRNPKLFTKELRHSFFYENLDLRTPFAIGDFHEDVVPNGPFVSTTPNITSATGGFWHLSGNIFSEPRGNEFRNFVAMDMLAKGGEKKAMDLKAKCIQTPVTKKPRADWNGGVFECTGFPLYKVYLEAPDALAWLKMKEPHISDSEFFDFLFYCAKTSKAAPLEAVLSMKLKSEEKGFFGDLKSLRWGDKAFVVDFITKKPELFEKGDGYEFLCEGFRLKDAWRPILKRKKNYVSSSEDLLEAIVILNGKPLKEIDPSFVNEVEVEDLTQK